MFFRNLTFFRFPPTLKKSFAGIDAALAECALKPVGPLEAMSRGFVSPFGRDEPVLSHAVGEALWLTLGGEDKILPAAVINDVMNKRITEIESKDGRKLGGRARKRLKEDLVHELLPRALEKGVRFIHHTRKPHQLPPSPHRSDGNRDLTQRRRDRDCHRSYGC